MNLNRAKEFFKNAQSGIEIAPHKDVVQSHAHAFAQRLAAEGHLSLVEAGVHDKREKRQVKSPSVLSAMSSPSKKSTLKPR